MTGGPKRDAFEKKMKQLFGCTDTAKVIIIIQSLL